MGLAVLAVAMLPAGVRAQCAIDLVDAGIQAYRDLELRDAKLLLHGALDENDDAPSPCWTENARILMYLGATHWLEDRPDSAAHAFEQAVVQAPRFRPDGVEFPPDLTELFERISRSTPAVVASVPPEIEIGPGRQRAMRVQLTASTEHWVTAALRSTDGRLVRTLYHGYVDPSALGTVLEWDGRGAHGETLPSGVYALEVVSLDSMSLPIRKVAIELSVEVDVPPPILGATPREPTPEVPVPSTGSGSNTWGAVATGGAGLLGGALVLGLPYVIDGSSGSWTRYTVAGSVAVAGVVGLLTRLGDGRERPTPSPRARTSPSSPEGGGASGRVDDGPVIRLRAGREHRTELADG